MAVETLSIVSANKKKKCLVKSGKDTVPEAGCNVPEAGCNGEVTEKKRALSKPGSELQRLISPK